MCVTNKTCGMLKISVIVDCRLNYANPAGRDAELTSLTCFTVSLHT